MYIFFYIFYDFAAQERPRPSDWEPLSNRMMEDAPLFTHLHPPGLTGLRQGV